MAHILVAIQTGQAADSSGVKPSGNFDDQLVVYENQVHGSFSHVRMRRDRNAESTPNADNVNASPSNTLTN